MGNTFRTKDDGQIGREVREAVTSIAGAGAEFQVELSATSIAGAGAEFQVELSAKERAVALQVAFQVALLNSLDDTGHIHF